MPPMTRFGSVYFEICAVYSQHLQSEHSFLSFLYISHSL